VGGEAVTVDSIVGPDQDMHVYEATPADARRFADAALVLVLGLSFDRGVQQLAKSSGFRGELVPVSAGIPTRKERSHDHAHSRSHGRFDPHVWQDPERARAMVRNIEAALAKRDPARAAFYRTNAERYGNEIRQLQAWASAELASVPEDQRKVVTSHESFGYLGERFAIRFEAPQGLGTESEPSAKAVARLIQQLKRDRTRAIFLENIANPRTLERIAQEAGVRVGGRLYSDALSRPDGPAASYLQMMQHNIAQIVRALRPLNNN
jgi:zinc/manganese transport system substrate-binding protein